jgi:hypothetical protein
MKKKIKKNILLLKINMAKSPKSRKSPKVKRSKSPKASKRSKSPKASKRTKRSKRSKRSKASKSSKGSPSKHIAWCVRCHDNVKMTGCKLAKAKNGRLMLKGKCVECGTKVNRFVKNGTKSC